MTIGGGHHSFDIVWCYIIAALQRSVSFGCQQQGDASAWTAAQDQILAAPASGGDLRDIAKDAFLDLDLLNFLAQGW